MLWAHLFLCGAAEKVIIVIRGWLHLSLCLDLVLGGHVEGFIFPVVILLLLTLLGRHCSALAAATH
jgi:hypothetical protein